MSVSELPWQDIFWRLSLPPHVMATLDWVSGVIIINEDIETFFRVRREGASNSYEKELMRTYSHELIHYYQVLLTGYLYEFVATINDQIEHCIAIARGNRNINYNWQEMVTFFDNLPQSDLGPWRGRLISKMADLRKTDTNGLSIMDIVEGQATYVEMTDTYDCNSAGFRQLLDRHRVPRSYRFAYDFTCQQLGEEAGFGNFLFICSLSLCSSHPVMSFYRLINYIGSLKSDYISAAQLTELIESCCVSRYLGFPLDTPSSVAQGAMMSSSAPVHYRVAMDAIRHAVASNQTDFDVLSFYVNPQGQLAELVQIAFPPMMFNPFPTGKIPFVKGRPEDPDFSRTHRALLRAIACHQLVANKPSS